MFEGMVIDGKCLELALEPQNEKVRRHGGWGAAPMGLLVESRYTVEMIISRVSGCEMDRNRTSTITKSKEGSTPGNPPATVETQGIL